MNLDGCALTNPEIVDFGGLMWYYDGAFKFGFYSVYGGGDKTIQCWDSCPPYWSHFVLANWFLKDRMLLWSSSSDAINN